MLTISSGAQRREQNKKKGSRKGWNDRTFRGRLPSSSPVPLIKQMLIKALIKNYSKAIGYQNKQNTWYSETERETIIKQEKAIKRRRNTRTRGSGEWAKDGFLNNKMFETSQHFYKQPQHTPHATSGENSPESAEALSLRSYFKRSRLFMQHTLIPVCKNNECTLTIS